MSLCGPVVLLPTLAAPIAVKQRSEETSSSPSSRAELACPNMTGTRLPRIRGIGLVVDVVYELRSLA